MGKKIEIKKIEGKKTCQVTYNKRKNSLIKKAREISIACGIDIALITFSPSKQGLPTKFSSRERIEELIQCYLNLPPEKKFHEVKNYKRQVRCTCHTGEKLKQLDHINGDESKMHYIKNQIKDIELRIKKTSLDVEILNNRVKFYEPESVEDILPSQLVWLERNLTTNLQKVQQRKRELVGIHSRKYKKFSLQQKNKVEKERKDGNQNSYKSKESDELIMMSEQEKGKPSLRLLPLQKHPRIAPNRSSSLSEGGSFQELLAQVISGTSTSACNYGIAAGNSNNNFTQNLSILEEPAPSFPSNFYSSSEIQSIDLTSLGIHNYPITATSEHNWNSDFKYSDNLPLDSERNLSPLELELFDLTNIDVENIVTAVISNDDDNNNDDDDDDIIVIANNKGNNDNNGGGDTSLTQVNSLSNVHEHVEKGEARTSNIEGNKDDNKLWDMDYFKWAEDLSLEDINNLLNEL